VLAELPAHAPVSNTEGLCQSLLADGMPGLLWPALAIDICGGLITCSREGMPITRFGFVTTYGCGSLGHAGLFTPIADPFQSGN